MIITSIKLCNEDNDLGIQFGKQFNNELKGLGKIVLLTGGNGSGKSRFLKLLQTNFEKCKNATNNNDITFNVGEVDEANNVITEEPFSSSSSKAFNLINYSHFDAKLQSSRKFSPYVIHQSKYKLQHCDYGETALNSLLYLKDLSEGYSEESNESNNYKALVEFIEFAKDLELDFNWNPEEQVLKIFNREIEKACLSPGQIYALRIAVACKAHRNGDNFIFLLDEPETHLHPSLLIKIIDKLTGHFNNAQFWISTHSLTLISYLSVTRKNPTIFYMENGCVNGKLRSNSEPILNSLIGMEDTRFAVKQLFVSSEEMACNKFCIECFLPPKVIEEAKSNDTSTQMVEDDLNSNEDKSEINILDFGAGKARLLSCLYEDNYKKGYVYNAYNVDVVDAEECTNIIKSLGAVGKSFLKKDSLEPLYGTVDRVYMVNVLHEIKLTDWKEEFALVNKLLNEEGQLIIIERETLTVGESPNNGSYLMLTPTENKPRAAEIMFGEDNVDFMRHKTKEYVIGYSIKKNGLSHIQNADMLQVLETLKKEAYLQICKLKNIRGDSCSAIDNYKSGLQLAFWLNQYLSTVINADEFNNVDKIKND